MCMHEYTYACTHTHTYVHTYANETRESVTTNNYRQVILTM